MPLLFKPVSKIVKTNRVPSQQILKELGNSSCELFSTDGDNLRVKLSLRKNDKIVRFRKELGL